MLLRYLPLLTMLFMVSAWSRDDVTNLSIKEAFDSPQFKDRLGDSVKFYFAG